MNAQEVGLSTLVSLVGAGLGIVGVLLATRAPAHVDPRAQALSTLGDVDACLQLQGGVEQELQALAQEQARLDFTETLMRAQLGPIGGLPSVWPDDVDPEWTEAELRPRVEEADARVDVAEVLELDCAEFPCLALVETTGPRSTQRGLTAGVDAGALARGMDLETQVSASNVETDGGMRGYGVVLLGPTDLPEQVAQRTTVRTRRAMQDLRERLQDQPVPADHGGTP